MMDKPKIVFQFNTVEERERWMASYMDGGGEDGVYEAYVVDGDEYPEIKITREN